MSDDQKKAATTLGWDYDSWDCKYENKDWNDLPKTVQEAATFIGFTQEMWDDDSWPDDMDVHWDDLSDKQKNAVHVIGYVKETWG
mmetsp:Transcript_1135/g.1489  ORF Transcript_1135/g.1489 Transcript_1135/m.1489 type:complete len:85 (+) Transcript_1135:494-748(+)